MDFNNIALFGYDIAKSVEDFFQKVIDLKKEQKPSKVCVDTARKIATMMTEKPKSLAIFSGPDDYYGFTSDQWLQWAEESLKELNTTKEDIDDIKAIALDIQQMAAKANYSDNTFAEFAYDVDQAMRAVLEIIEKPKYSIIKVISREETK